MPYIIDTYTQALAHAYKEDVSEVLDQIVKTDVAFLGLLNTSGKRATAFKHYWLAEDVTPEVVQSHGALTINSATSMIVTNADALWLKVGAILKDKAKDTLVRVTVIGAADSSSTGYATITISKHPGSGAVEEAHADHASWRIVSLPAMPGGTPTTDNIVQREEMYNAVQIFERGIKVIDEVALIEARGVSNEMAHQIAIKTIDVKRELAFAVLYGKYSLATSINEASTMGGIIEFLMKADTNKVDAGAAALTPTMLNDSIGLIQDDGVMNPSHIVVGTANSRVVSTWDSSSIRRDPSDKQRGLYVDSFLSDTGLVLPIIHEKELDPKFCMILRASDLSLTPMDPWSKYTWPRTTYSDHQTLKGSYTLEVRNYKKAHSLIYNLG